jgi:hypothetical protein
MTTTTDELERRLAQLKRAVPARGMERHPLLLHDLSELPAELQSPGVRAMAASQQIKPIIAFPPQIHRGWHYVPKQALLFTPDRVIHLLASIWPDQEPTITQLAGSGLMYLKATLLLLYGHLEIVGQGADSTSRLAVEFNTVAWEGLAPPLRRLLHASQPASGAGLNRSARAAAAQQAASRLPLKFSNGVEIHGLLPGEIPEELLFQPGTWERRLLVFRRPVLANTLLLLSTNYMVVIQEELKVSQGWIITYIPRGGIRGVQCRPRSQWHDLVVQLERGSQTASYTLRLTDEAARAWRQKWVQQGGGWQDLPAEVK